VRDVESQTTQSGGNQVLFPMVVGVIFLAVLVMGALFG